MKLFGENCRRLTKSPGLTRLTRPGEDDLQFSIQSLFKMFSGKSEPPPLSEQELVIPSWRTGEPSASASYRPSHRRNASLPPRSQDKKQVDCSIDWSAESYPSPSRRNLVCSNCMCFLILILTLFLFDLRRPPPCRDTVTCRGPRGPPSGITTSQRAE